MSGGHDNNLKFALFPNDDQREGKRDPDMRGSCEIDGVQYWMDAWWNESKGGLQYLGGKLKPKESQEQRGGSRNPPTRTSAPRGGPPPRQAPRREEAPPHTEAPEGRSKTDDDWSDSIPF